MANDRLIEINIEGQGLRPGKISNKQLAKILNLAEAMFTSAIEQENPHLEQVFIGLTSIEPGSVRLRFEPSHPEVAFPALRKIAGSVRDTDYSDIPPGTLKSLKEMRTIAQRKRWTFDFVAVNGQRQTLASLTSETVIEAAPSFSAPTTVYGYVIRVGGRRPKVLIETASGRGISCEFKGKSELKRQVAQQLAPRIYTWVGLRGTAVWNAKDYTLREFIIDSISEFGDQSPIETLKALGGLLGDTFRNIDDVDAYVKELRS